MNKEKLEKIGAIVIAAVVIVGFAFSILTDDFEHIEDTNGTNNYNIQRISESDMLDLNYGSKGFSYTKENFKLGGVQLGGVTFSSKKYSGVTQILETDYILNSTFELTIYEYEIKEGNFELIVVNNGKIVGKFKPDLASTLRIDNLKGRTQVIAVGESANFKFKLLHEDYNDYTHYE